ncbi:hypothetical protein [Longispora albida]|uniref:hypothetical protein n=1 Tax=Longispora albida TaxID=203523 RepID=UPI00036A09DE|nr:hypothetical protein [Longispora albida]
MNSTKRFLTALGISVAVVAPGVAATGTAAQADITFPPACGEVRDTTATASAPGFEVKLCGVTDVDQLRVDLIGNGNTHCGPATVYNTLNYIGKKHNLPITMGPNGTPMNQTNPASAAGFDATTAWLGWLGLAAGQGWDGGSTSMYGNRKSFDEATAKARAAGHQFARGQIDTADTPEFGHELAKKLSYAPVQMVFGRYSMTNTNAWKRTGGHFVTVVQAKGSIGTGKVELLVHDPAAAPDHGTTGYLETQSPYRLETITLERKTVLVTGTDAEGDIIFAYRTVWELTGPSYGGTKFVEALNWYAYLPPVG